MVYLPDDLQQAAGSFILPFLLDGFDNRQQVRGFYSGNMSASYNREDVLFHPVQNRSPVFFCKVTCSGIVPFQCNTLKSIFHFGKLLFLGGFFLRSGVDAVCQQLLCFIPALPRILKGDDGIFAKAQELGLLFEAIGHAPEFSPGFGDGKIQSSAVKMLLLLVGGFQTADLNIGERHVGTPCSWLDFKIPT